MSPGVLVFWILKVTILIGGALLTGRLFRTSAATRHAILVLAVLGSLLVPVFSTALPTFSPVSVPLSAVSRHPEVSRVSDILVSQVFVRSDGETHRPGRPHTGARSRVGDTIVALWLVGFGSVLARIVTDLRRAGEVLRGASGEWQTAEGVPLRESEEVEAPVTIGLLRPVVILPAHRTFEPEAFRQVVAHELAHVARRDCLSQLAVRFACAAWWFHPLVWLAARRIVLERERACDDNVLAAGEDPISYSELLIDVARRNGRNPMNLHAASTLVQPGQLERRIRSVLDSSVPRGGLSRFRLGILAIMVFCFVVPVSALGLKDRPPADAGQDPFFFSQSERVPGDRPLRRDGNPIASGDPDSSFIETLMRAARREPLHANDLVPDRARWALELSRQESLDDQLTEALEDEDWRVQGYAAWTLGVRRDARAVPSLVNLVEDPVWRLRAAAAYALREIGDPAAAPAMARLAEDEAWQVRAEVAGYFGSLRDTSHADLLETLAGDSHIAVRLAAQAALDELN